MAFSLNDLKTLTETDINTPIPSRTLDIALNNLSFLPIPNAINIRDLGGLPSSPIRSGLIYRSGAIHPVDPSSLTSLSLSLILDLRSDREIHRNPNPSIPGVQKISLPGTRAPSPINMTDFIPNAGADGYAAMYMEILEIYAPSFKRALEWLRDEQTPMLFHCTAGKDRTGVLAALLLVLAGAGREVVALDYSLTRVGVERDRGVLLQMLMLWNKVSVLDLFSLHFGVMFGCWVSIGLWKVVLMGTGLDGGDAWV